MRELDPFPEPTRKRRRRFDDDERRTTRTRVDLTTFADHTDVGDFPSPRGLFDPATLDERAGAEDDGPPEATAGRPGTAPSTAPSPGRTG